VNALFRGLAALSLLLALAGGALAAPPAPVATRGAAPRNAPAADAQGPVPTRIFALKLNYQQKDNQAVFEGQVRVERPNLTVLADRMVVFFKPAPTPAGQPVDAAADVPAGNQEIERIVATGKVRILRGPYVGTGGKATYLAAEEVVILEDKPLVVNETDRSSLRGEVLRMYLRDNRSEAEGSGKAPVEMFFTSTPSRPAEQGGQAGQGRP